MRRLPVAALAIALLSTGCTSEPFGWPDVLDAPGKSRVLVNEDTHDKDNTVRARVKVVQVPKGMGDAEVLAHYRASSRESDGWSVASSDATSLCMVNTRDDAFVAVLEVRPFVGHRFGPAAGRHLVVNSRLAKAEQPCGATDRWISKDLLAPR